MLLYYKYLLVKITINREPLEALGKPNVSWEKNPVLLNFFCFPFVVCYFPSFFVLRDVWMETELLFLKNFLLLLCVPSSG